MQPVLGTLEYRLHDMILFLKRACTFMCMASTHLLFDLKCVCLLDEFQRNNVAFSILSCEAAAEGTFSQRTEQSERG